MILLNVFERGIEPHEINKSISTVLHIQRVNSFFRHTVQGSSKLKRALNKLELYSFPKKATTIHAMLYNDPWARFVLNRRVPFAGLNNLEADRRSPHCQRHALDAMFDSNHLAFLVEDKGSWRDMQVFVQTAPDEGDGMMCKVYYTCRDCDCPDSCVDLNVFVPCKASAGELADTMIEQVELKHGQVCRDILQARKYRELFARTQPVRQSAWRASIGKFFSGMWPTKARS